MEIVNLCFIVTDDCNLNCTYCYQKKEKKTITNSTIEKTINFFYPFLNREETYIGFYGGEPLLAYDKVVHAASLLQEKNKEEKKNLKFTVTTNGTLLTKEMMDFFNRHKIGLLLSFDGLTQDKGRKKGTLEQMIHIVKQSRDYPGIDLEINSVFSPYTVNELSESMRFLIELEGPEITYNISTTDEWSEAELETLKSELDRLCTYLLSYYKEKGKIPVRNLRPARQKEKTGENEEKSEKKKGSIFHCTAGRNRMAVTPEGKLYGCWLFHDYFKNNPDSPQLRDFCFGPVGEFIAGFDTLYPEILPHYADLHQDLFQVEEDFCFLCEELEGCVVCPANAAISSGSLGKISRRHCRLGKIQRHTEAEFRRKVSELKIKK